MKESERCIGGPWDGFEFSHGYHKISANIILQTGIYVFSEGAWQWRPKIVQKLD